MEDFLYKFSTLPHQFISDFFVITREDYRENELVINFDTVAKWLQVQKNHLKRVLISNFEEKYDYISNKKHRIRKGNTGATTYYEILITPNCFRELCMISRTAKAKEVRKYFIEMEKLVKRYHEVITEEMYQEIGLLRNNQKPKLNIKCGVLYILRALNSGSSVYKIGKTSNLSQRLTSYNSGNANNIVPEFIIPVKDIDAAENCVKSLVKRFKYRKYKEVYEMDIDILKGVLEKCVEISDYLESSYKNNKRETSKKIDNIKEMKDDYYIYLEK